MGAKQLTVFNACAKCCMDIDINPVHLLLPQMMNADGQEFVRVHGLDKVPIEELQHGAILMDNGMVKIRHRCDQLQSDGRCAIYDDRPKICREFKCETRRDCLHGTV